VVQTLTRRGAFFSFGGGVLGQNHRRAQAALRAVPLDRLLLETDAPALLPPEKYRRYVLQTTAGERYNEPANLRGIAEGIAGLLGMSAERLGEITGENAARLLLPS
ncbi:MAG: TatD family hydrolase, partial [Armatimonadota bacterium]